MLPEFDLDFQNPLADKELTGKGETSEATPSISETAAALNDAEIDEFIEKNQNTNTAEKTKSDLNLI